MGNIAQNIIKFNRLKEVFMANFENIGKALSEYTSHGAFIVAGDKPEIMTASWGFIGEMWGKRRQGARSRKNRAGRRECVSEKTIRQYSRLP